MNSHIPTIGIDASPLVRDTYTGTEWYTFDLLKGLFSIEESNQYNWLLYANGPKPKNLQIPTNVKWKELRWPIQKGWIQGRLSLEMIFNPPDLLFVPANRLPFILPKKVITTVADVAFIKHPEFYSKLDVKRLTSALKRLKNKNVMVIAITKAVQNDIEFLLPDLVGRLFVVHLASDHRILTTNNKIKSKYVLYIGSKSLKKGTDKLIYIFERMVKSGYKGNLVLIGKEGIGYKKVNDTIEASQVKTQIINKPWLDDEEVGRYLASAEVVVLPSEYEGFNLVVLESQQARIPLVIADTSVNHEVAGKGAVYINPIKFEESAIKILTLLKDTAKIEQMKLLGFANASNFTVKKMAHETLAVFKKVVDK